MIEKWFIFREVFRRGQVSGREHTRDHFEHLGVRNPRNPIVIAPTMQMARHICKQFNLDPQRHAHGSDTATLRGLGPGTVFMVYYDAPWNPEVYDAVMRTIQPSRGLIIMVPELTKVNRPTSAGMSW